MWSSQSEAMAPEQREVLRSWRLAGLVKRLFETVPFYQKALADRGISPGEVHGATDAPLLPFTTRQDLRDQYPFGLLSVPRERIARLHATSGTKGKPTLVAYTAADLVTWSEIAGRALYAAGCRPGEIWYVASGYGLFTGGLGAHYGLERVGAAVVPASSGNTQRLLGLMADLPPAGIHCIPSYMLRVAEVAEAQGLDPRGLGLRYGSFGGETWSEPLRRRIEALFGLTAFDIYGLSECFGPGVAFECEAHDGLHLSEDHFLFEVIDPTTGQPVPEGERGELVITSLTKEAMPLLRYRTGDLTRILPGPCACGRTLRRMERVRGRADDMLIIRGVNLFPSEVERLLLQFPELDAQHRLVIDRTGPLDELTVEVEAALADEALAQNVAQKIKADLGVSAKVAIVPPGSLPRSEGKAVRVLDRRPQE